MKKFVQTNDLKVALVHYWLLNARGGEAVLEAIGRITPHADLYTNVADPDAARGSLATMPLRTTSIGRLPFARKLYPLYLPLMPGALEALDMNDYDLIISSEAGPAKWVLPRPGAAHICYCHSPMRYIWDQREGYLSRLPPILRPLGRRVAGSLRTQDVLSSFRVTQFVANSNFVAQRINQFYRRDARVVHPPVDVSDYSIGVPEDFYLCAGQVVSYKRIDLAVQACARLGRQLIVAGGGDVSRLRELAGPHVRFLGQVDRLTFRSLMSRCRALLFPGVEDFGIVPVEVMASGRPVIAFNQGGALDSIEPGRSGQLFDRQSVDGLVEAILQFEAGPEYSAADCRRSAERFDRAEFERNFSEVLADSLGRNGR